MLFALFAMTALVLAAAGIYGVVSDSVAHRTGELGVRSALGASAHTILAMKLRQGAVLTGWGIALGIAGTMIAAKTLTALLFNVSSLDPITYSSVVVLLTVVSVIACGVPSWRALHVDPAQALRSE